MPFRVESRRKGGLARVEGVPDVDILQTQSGCEFQFRPAHRESQMLFGIDRKVVHERIIRIRSRPVTVCGERRILVVFSLTDISVCLPLHSGLQVALHIIPPLVPAVLERSGKIQFLRIGDLIGEIGQRELVGKEIPILLGMDCRLMGC